MVPFLFELRTILDWMFTPTSLMFPEWLRVEYIFSQIYQIKCRRVYFKNHPLRGRKQTAIAKFLIGGAVTLLILAILWFPLFFFAFTGVLGQPSIPKDVFVKLQFGNYEPIFKADAPPKSIQHFTAGDWKKLTSLYAKRPEASLFLESFNEHDVVAVSFSRYSSSDWGISEPNFQRMRLDLKNGVLKSGRFSFNLIRDTGEEIIKNSIAFDLNNERRNQLLTMLQTNSSNFIEIANVFPKIIKITSMKQLENIPELIWPPETGTYNLCFSFGF